MNVLCIAFISYYNIVWSRFYKKHKISARIMIVYKVTTYLSNKMYILNFEKKFFSFLTKNTLFTVLYKIKYSHYSLKSIWLGEGINIFFFPQLGHFFSFNWKKRWRKMRTFKKFRNLQFFLHCSLSFRPTRLFIFRAMYYSHTIICALLNCPNFYLFIDA